MIAKIEDLLDLKHLHLIRTVIWASAMFFGDRNLKIKTQTKMV
jgi:hypothetical protein